MFCYVECQAACFDWLCCLLPVCPSAPSLSRGRHAWKYGDLGGLWHAGIVTGCWAQLFLSSSPYVALSLMKACIWSFPSSLLAYPADIHMFIQGLPAEIRHAERCMDNPPQDFHPPPLGTHLGCLWTFPQCTNTQAVGSLMIQPLPAHLPTSTVLLCCPNSHSAGSTQRAMFCCTISIPEAHLFGVRNLLKVML